ncbi:MAG: carbonate dehydratase [Chlamydiales bacterium]|nr:carbonate dehydratase [Chlamydiales bacterium]
MRKLKQLFENNRLWADGIKEKDPKAFEKMAKGQKPRYLWIGCSDSRIPANEILGLEPGEVFVHRNIANICAHTDLNYLSVLQFAVDYLGVEHVIVCGHYGCGGVAAAMQNNQLGLIDNWLRLIRDTYAKEKEKLDAIKDGEERSKALVEHNVLYQVLNVCHTTIVQNAWANKKKLTVHGWVYDISTGLLKDLDCCISSIDQIEETYRTHELH